MKILVVSGFLGAGKTTFISHLMQTSRLRPVILENEYGSASLDAKTLKQSDETSVLEFMEGCVCCSQKDAFVNSLLTIHASLSPDYLIVEPSGIGKLSNVMENIHNITFGDIELLHPVLILSIQQIDSYLNAYPDIYADQLQNAGTIIFSKIEREDPALIRQAVEKIRAYNDRATIIDTPYQSKDAAFFEQLMGHKNEAALVKTASEHPSDIQQETIAGAKPESIGQLVFLLEDIVRGRFGGIVRAKGEVSVCEERLRFDVADGQYGVIGAEEDGSVCKCVFIGSNLDLPLIRDRFRAVSPADRSAARKKKPAAGKSLPLRTRHS